MLRSSCCRCSDTSSRTPKPGHKSRIRATLHRCYTPHTLMPSLETPLRVYTLSTAIHVTAKRICHASGVSCSKRRRLQVVHSDADLMERVFLRSTVTGNFRQALRKRLAFFVVHLGLGAYATSVKRFGSIIWHHVHRTPIHTPAASKGNTVRTLKPVGRSTC